MLRGRQDTLLLDTPSYADVSHVHLRRCLIEGDVDFIYGRATALLAECEIRSVGPGFVTAPSTARENPRGFLMLGCRLTADDGVPAGSVSLGRAWHPGGKLDAVGQAWFVGCDLGEHIAAEPWADMGGFSWRDARFAEHGSTGPGAGVGRIGHSWPRRPTADEWLQGWHGWDERGGAIVVVGDSTASSYHAEDAPREGWAQRLGEHGRSAGAQSRALGRELRAASSTSGCWTRCSPSWSRATCCSCSSATTTPSPTNGSRTCSPGTPPSCGAIWWARGRGARGRCC